MPCCIGHRSLSVCLSCARSVNLAKLACKVSYLQCNWPGIDMSLVVCIIFILDIGHHFFVYLIIIILAPFPLNYFSGIIFLCVYSPTIHGHFSLTPFHFSVEKEALLLVSKFTSQFLAL